MADLAASLARCPLLHDLDPAVLQQLADAANVRPLRRGQVLFEQGDAGGSLVAVLEGRIALSLHSRDGDRMVVGVVTAPATLGELTVADGGPRSTAAEALEPARVALLPRQAVLRAAATSAPLLERLLRELATLARRQTRTSAELTFLDLPRRLVSRLLDSADAAGRVELGLSQRDLAAMVGGSRQSVNQALGDLARRGWLRVEGSSITLLDQDALRRYAQG